MRTRASGVTNGETTGEVQCLALWIHGELSAQHTDEAANSEHSYYAVQ
jgi:hypothetical protein